MEQLYPLADTSSCANQGDDFLNYWVDKTVEKEILRGKKLRELKARPSARREKYDVITIGNSKLYCEKKRPRHRNKSPNTSRNKHPERRKLSHKLSNSSHKRCPLRIAELAVPSKRQCIDTWRTKYHILPIIMLHRLQQHIFDLTPVVKIPEAIECFKRHKSLERKKMKQEKIKAIKEDIKRNNCVSKIQKKTIKLHDCRNLCAIFGHKIAKELNRPAVVTLNSELEKISNVVSIEIENVINKDKGCGRTGRNKKTQAEVADKISIWIANILEETAYKILDDQLKDLEEEVGPVLDLIDNLIDDVVCACEPEPSMIESPSDETIIVESSTESKHEEDNNQIEDEKEMNVDEYIINELDKIINNFDKEGQQDTEVENQTQQDIKEEKGGDEEQNEFSDAYDNFDLPGSTQDRITNPEKTTDNAESHQNADSDKDLETQQQRPDENTNQDNVQQDTEINKDQDMPHQSSNGSLDQDNLQQSTDRNVNQDDQQQSTNGNIDQGGQQQSTDRNVNLEDLQQNIVRNENHENLHQINDRNVDQDNLQQSNVRIENQENIQHNTGGNINQDNIQQSADRNINQDGQQNEYQDNLQQSTDRNDNQENIQQSTGGNINQNNIQQSDDRNVDQDNQQRSTDRNVSQDFLQQSINKNTNQDYVQQNTDINSNFQDYSEDDLNKKVTFSNIDIVTNDGKSTTEIADVNFQIIQEIDPNLVFAEPNDHLLTDADEPWPEDITFPILRPSESVSKSITSLGKIMEAEERTSATLDEDGNVTVPFTANTEVKLPETNKIIRDTFKDDIGKPQDGQTRQKSMSADERINQDELDIDNRRTSTDSTFDHHVPTETIPYEISLDKILEEDTTQVSEKLDKLLENAAIQEEIGTRWKDEGIQVSKDKEEKKTVDAKEGTQVSSKDDKKGKTADKEINTSFLLVPREDKSTSVVSKSLEDITKRIQGVKPDDMFSSLRIKQKIDYKVHKKSAPYWVARHYEEPSISSEAPQPQQKTGDKHIRLWCRDLENGFDNLELWNGWIENTLESLSILEHKKARICIDKSREEFVRDWYQLKNNLDTDVLTWTRLSKSTQDKLKAFRKVYPNFKTLPPGPNKTCNCHPQHESGRR